MTSSNACAADKGSAPRARDYDDSDDEADDEEISRRKDGDDDEAEDKAEEEGPPTAPAACCWRSAICRLRTTAIESCPESLLHLSHYLYLLVML